MFGKRRNEGIKGEIKMGLIEFLTNGLMNIENYRKWLEKKNAELPKYDTCFRCHRFKIIRRYFAEEFFSYDLKPWCDDCYREQKAIEF